jgi:glycosyl transferase family 1
VLREQHVMLRLARGDGAYRPPLEAFHAGVTCVTTPVSGVEEYVRHAWNGLVVGWDDPHGTARTLDLLASDRARLHYLRLNASATARAWPSVEQSSQFMALALRAVRREPSPRPGSSGPRVASDFASALADSERQAWRVDTREALVEELTSQKAWQWAMSIRGAYLRVGRLLGRARHRLRRLTGR